MLPSTTPSTSVVKPDVLHQRFEKAAERAANLKNLSNDLRLDMYGLFKQATVGNCTTTEPSRWSVVEHAKWKAWNKLIDMTETNAKQAYIEMVGKADPSFEEPNSTVTNRSSENIDVAVSEQQKQDPQISVVIEDPSSDHPTVIVEEIANNGNTVRLTSLQVDDPSAPVDINIEALRGTEQPISDQASNNGSSLIQTIRAATSSSESPVPTWAVFLLGVLFLCLLDDNLSLGNIMVNGLGVAVFTAILISLQIK